MKMRCIINVRICDGTGKEPCPGEILLDGERIADLCPQGTFRKEEYETVDGGGCIAAPGFIDVHAHSEFRKLKYPEWKTKLLQGVTTEVDGNCGSSPGCVPGSSGKLRWKDFEEFASVLDSVSPSVNTVCLCGHNSLRRTVMGDADRLPTPDEQKKMNSLLTQALEQGAAGFSSGLTYLPGKFSDTAELISLAGMLKGTGKPYVTHMRSEGDTLLEAVEEAISIAKAGSGQLQISHLKTIFPRNFSKITALLTRLEEERGRGMTLFADRYPYVRSATIFRQILPAPYDRIVRIGEWMKGSDTREAELEKALLHSPRDIGSTILSTGSHKGLTVAEAAAADGLSVEREAVLLLKENEWQNVAFLCMSEENMMQILAEEWVCPGSDGISAQLDDPADFNHPRAAGTFPKYFELVSPLVGIPETIRRMTSLPASLFRIPDRGILKKGYAGDVVIFDPASFRSRADFKGENQFPEGIRFVFVAGKTAYDSRCPEKIGRYGKTLRIQSL